ncbi:predicted protein [Naegleria gruberi]|uniref:Predicted protein n=1 Tax=Naegleria gruberi TaxID=5762 RepID=D2VEJ5_NAEGR|nr:uncharacterized protein NAEGRDRAFT_67300 [Naegleria gruberi]EFC44807.1 predicted protein [Naegleria gruberi]|eukprot:XP_002677551.1 predicted protein [Naegleria gruberi strain NEG-M]
MERPDVIIDWRDETVSEDETHLLYDENDSSKVVNKPFVRILGYIFWWEEKCKTLSPHHQPIFARENPQVERLRYSQDLPESVEGYPVEEYLKYDTQWLETVKYQCYCYARIVSDVVGSGVSGFQLSPSFASTTRTFVHYIPQASYYSTNNHYTMVNQKNLAKIRIDWFRCEIVELEKKLHAKIFRKLGMKEKLPETKEKPKKKFDFSLLERKKPNRAIPIEANVNYVIPNINYPIKLEDPIMLIGYPKRVTKQYYLDNYENDRFPLYRDDFDNFFGLSFFKIGSLGRIKSFNDNYILVSNSALCGMGGSPVLTFDGQLIGFLIGSTKKLEYNIVMRVNHPSFIIEYLSFPAFELLELNQDLYFPLLEYIITKHLHIIEIAINSKKLKNERKRQNLVKILQIYQQRIQKQ